MWRLMTRFQDINVIMIIVMVIRMVTAELVIIMIMKIITMKVMLIIMVMIR